jgi:uncharacterized protein with HEPN domain
MKDKRLKNYERFAHILQAIHDIEVFIHDIDSESFLKDRLVASAVLFQFSVIGEGINHVEGELLSKYEYPWHKVRAFRNLISQVYFQVKLEAVWDTIINDLPALKEQIENILKQEF